MPQSADIYSHPRKNTHADKIEKQKIKLFFFFLPHTSVEVVNHKSAYKKKKKTLWTKHVAGVHEWKHLMCAESQSLSLVHKSSSCYILLFGKSVISVQMRTY